MLLGYMMLVVLSIAVVVYVLASLRQLNRLNDGIIRVDVPVREAAETMLDAVLSQDAYEKRSLIMARREVRSLFWKRADEFDRNLAVLKALPDADRLPLQRLEKLHRQYGNLFIRETKLVKAGNLDEASALSNGALRTTMDQLVELLRTISADAKQSQDAGMKNISELGSSAFITTAILCVLSVIIGVLAGLYITNHIASSVGKLKVAAARVAEGDFFVDPKIDDEDEIGGLSMAFRQMGQRLGKLEEMSLDASPLTRLPGGRAIDTILKQRIASGQPFAFCLIDLDNFKVFNDRYGYAHGNEVLKAAAGIIEASAKSKGAPEDFVGHIGGDDFVVITTTQMMRAVAEDIIRQFDARIPSFYSEQDRQNGFIFGKSRQGEEMRFPLMTISIAIVTSDRHALSTPIQVAEIAAELKDHAKTIEKSIYIVDKRRAE
jgi:diguanylate cyclase (GGDEF)-like protein